MRTDIFRKVALEKLSSPEQLDQMMHVTTPRGWLGLATLGALVVVAGVWSVAGSIPERVQGQGILLRSGGLFAVEAISDGSVTDLAVRVGDVVTEGQVVARLAQPDLADRIRQARAKVAEHEAELNRVTDFGSRDLGVQGRRLAQQRANLEQSIEAANRTLQALEERRRNEEALVRQGLITRQTLLSTTQQVEDAREKARSARAELAQLQVQELQSRNETGTRRQQAEVALSQARRELVSLEDQLRLSSEVTSRYTGRVLELMVEQGSVVTRGQPVMTIDLTGKSVKDLEVVVYIPSLHGKQVRPGMEIQIAPSTVRREEYGYLLGKVTYVSDFPATPAGMRRVLKNDQLVTTLSGQDAPYEIHADLIPDPDPRNASRYRWSSSSGPPIRIQSGTLANASVVVERRKPIFMVLPPLRRHADARREAEAQARSGSEASRPVAVRP
ncbi:MAG TPA: NHLP bacteriocin system secretion protein [Longimicrobium sp.]|nr:NHLP bacteriocin system secretion protein [Longimicrobium sp.]